MRILVTGGAGYLGSHTTIELLNANHDVILIDNLSNSKEEVIYRLNSFTQRVIPFYKIDINDRASLASIFKKYRIDCCVHFAGLKAVGESVLHPLKYYENNISGTLTLLSVMQEYGCKNIIFSSSATVYGNTDNMPVTEDMPTGNCTNPYGQTKLMIEQILKDLYDADKKNLVEKPWNIVLLRYFNPIGAHPSGEFGENPNGIPNNLMPYITQVATGKLDKLHIFGDDYNTPDGTGVRDYIHVVDLARGHVFALKAIEEGKGLSIYNLGTGKGCSVLELVKTFERVSKITIPYVIDSRRPGDVAVCYSDSSKALKELGWTTQYSIEDMCRDSWMWQKRNPNGYE